MKKSKLLALALAAGITFMGAGYAAWSSNLTAETTLTTGTFDVNFVDKDIRTNVLVKDGSDWLDLGKENKYGITFSVEPKEEGVSKKLDFKFNGIMPNVHCGANFAIESSGTVPAAVGAVTIEATPNEEKDESAIYNDMTITAPIFLVRKNPSDGEDKVKMLTYVSGKKVSVFCDQVKSALNGVILKNGDQIKTTLTDEERQACKNNPKGHDTIYFRFDDKFGENDEDEGQNESMTLTMNIDFVQPNMVK